MIFHRIRTSIAKEPYFALFDLILYVPSTISQLNRDGSSWVEPVLSKDKCVLQRSKASEGRTRGPSVSSQALYHCAPLEPYIFVIFYGARTLCPPSPWSAHVFCYLKKLISTFHKRNFNIPSPTHMSMKFEILIKIIIQT